MLFFKRQKIKEVKELQEGYDMLTRVVNKTIVDECSVAFFSSNKYLPLFNTVFINLKTNSDKRGNQRAICHEFGHYIDHKFGLLSHNPEFSNAIRKDASYFMRMHDVEKVRRFINKYPYTHGLSDILTGLVDGVKFRYGHGKSYYERRYALEHETFAHFFEALARNDRDKMKLYEIHLPYSWEVFNDMLNMLNY